MKKQVVNFQWLIGEIAEAAENVSLNGRSVV